MNQIQASETESVIIAQGVGDNDRKTFRISIPFVLVILALLFIVSLKIFLAKALKWTGGAILGAIHFRKNTDE